MLDTIINTIDYAIEVTSPRKYINPIYRCECGKVWQGLIPKFVGAAHDEQLYCKYCRFLIRQENTKISISY